VYTPRDADRLGSLLVDLLRDPERLQAMGRAGRQAWETRFTPDRVARWHEDVYSEAMARR
jgi:glycosyltransferase involved in cell wall biosynthesis